MIQLIVSLFNAVEITTLPQNSFLSEESLSLAGIKRLLILVCRVKVDIALTQVVFAQDLLIGCNLSNTWGSLEFVLGRPF